MKRLLFVLGIAIVALQCFAVPLRAQTGCEGSSGSATIDGVPWSASCVIAATSPDCVDSLGASYECFQILGASETETIAIFLAQSPVSGQTYGLGGASGNGAMLVTESGFWLTADAPYVGEVQVTAYDPGSSTLECTFYFQAFSLFPGPDVNVTEGNFVGRLVAVRNETWGGVKELYREPGR